MATNDGIILDAEFEWVTFSPICIYCRHLTDVHERRCAAFQAIPKPIWNGDNPHTQPYLGDGGILFAAENR